MSDRPRYDAHTRWTSSLMLATAVPRRTPRRASSHLMASRWKPTTTAVTQYSYDATVDTHVAHAFLHSPLTLTYDIDFQSSMNYGHDHKHATKIKVECQLVQKIKQKRSDGHVRSHYLPH